VWAQVPFLMMSSKSRKWLLLAAGVVGIAYLLYRSRSALHLGESWRALRSANPWYIFAAVVLIYTCYFLRALRWQSFQKHVGDARLLSIFAMTLAGFSAVYLFGRVGEPVRPMLISRKSKVPLADIFGIYALERFIDMLFAGLILAAWFLITTARGSANPGLEAVRKTAGTILTVGMLGVAVLMLYVRAHGAAMLEGRLETWLAAPGWRASIARIVLGVVRGFKTIRSWRDLAYVLAISAVHWFLIIVVYQIVEHAFGGTLATLRFEDSILIVALTMVGSLLQLPGIGGGPQAVMTGAFTRFYGVPLQTAFAASMVIFLITFAVCCLAGAPLLFKEGLSFGELRKMREKEDKEIDAEMVAPPQVKSPRSAPADN
jgi:uncharacterized protein (TIRG00374 family)